MSAPSAFLITTVFGAGLLVGACSDDEPAGDEGGASQCVGGTFCPDGLVCVDGFCVPPGSETGGDGDGDGPGDGDGDGDSEGEGDGDSEGEGDGDGDPGPCGNGVLEAGETCDDGNSKSFDGCDADCQPSTVEALAAGDSFTCVSFGAAVRCWGFNEEGQLGIGSTEPHAELATMPAPVIDFGDDIEALALGSEHACVITSADELRCWGSGFAGRLGYGSSEHVGDQPGEMPPPPVDVGGTPVLIGLGDHHSCAVIDSGELRCWGFNASGELGYGHTDDIGDDPGEMPPPAVDVGGVPTQLGLGYDYTCVVLDTGKVRCWGLNHVGQLGLGHTDNIGDNPGEMPPPDLNLGIGTVEQVGAAAARSCARFDNGTVRCWGVGPLGYGVMGLIIGDNPADMPPAVLNIEGNALGMGVGAIHTCVLLAGGNVRCWGSATNGQLGYGHFFNDIGDEPGEMPPPDVLVGDPVARLALGSLHTCALTQSNEVRCWGPAYAHGLGQTIGDEPGEMPPDPVPIY